MENDPTVLEAARVLAGKDLQDNSNDQAKITRAFRLIICRKPNEKELSILTGLYNEELKGMDEQTAERVLNVGEYPMPQNIDKIAMAAMMKTIDTMYNL